METSALRATPVIQTHRAKRSIQRDADAYTAFKVLWSEARIPYAAKVREECALNFLVKREAIFYGAEKHSIAAELVVTIAAQRALSAESELVKFRHVAAPIASHGTKRPNLIVVTGNAEMLMINRRLLIMEVAAPKTARLQGEIDLATCRRIVDVVAGVGYVFQDDAARQAEIIMPPISKFLSGAVAHVAA